MFKAQNLAAAYLGYFFYPKSRALSWRGEEVSSKAEHTIEKNFSSFTTLSDREVSSCTISLRQKGLNSGISALFQNLACGEESPDKQSGSYDKLSTPFKRARLARQLLLVAKSPLAFSPLYIWLPRSLFLTIQNFYKNCNAEQCLREWYWQKSCMDLKGIILHLYY